LSTRLRFGQGAGFGGNVVASGGALPEATPGTGGRDACRSEDPAAVLCSGDHLLQTGGMPSGHFEPEGERGEEPLDGREAWIDESTLDPGDVRARYPTSTRQVCYRHPDFSTSLAQIEDDGVHRHRSLFATRREGNVVRKPCGMKWGSTVAERWRCLGVRLWGSA
jgi:hypothetical protein